MSSVPVPAAVLELEDEIKPYRERIERIDAIIHGPAKTLIRQALEAVETRRKAMKAQKKDAPRFPLWIAKDPVRNPWPNALTTSLCLVTLHRLHRMRRRFPKLKDEADKLGEALADLREGYLPERKRLKNGYFAACAHFVDSRTFGFLNPFTSAQVFRLLMESGEDHAHTGVGCLSFFGMVWPLYRRTEKDPLNIGARIEPYRPTAYVTAKCLLPLVELREICIKRAHLFQKIHKHLQTLHDLRGPALVSSLSHWRFCAEMDSLRHHLHEMAEISISRESFTACDANLEEPLHKIHPGAELVELFDSVVREVAVAMGGVRERSAKLLADAEHILDVVERDIIAILAGGKVPPRPRRTRDGELVFDPPRRGDDAGAGGDGFDRSAFRFDYPEAEQPINYASYLKELGKRVVIGSKDNILIED